MNYNKIIEVNIRMKKVYPNYPTLPKIVKMGNNNQLEVVEINPGHTESVFRGYLQRVRVFQKQYL